MLRQITAAAVVYLLVGSLNLFAQQPLQDGGRVSPTTPDAFPEYALGDQMLSINLGLMVPLFYHLRDGGVTGANMSIGGLGSLEWGSFLNNNVSLGIELGGSFAFDVNGNALFMVPITGKISYFFRSYPFEFPVFLGAGLNISRYKDFTKFDPILKPGVSFYWSYNPEWSFGVNTVYWWVPQVYRGSVPPSGHTAFGNFLEVSLSALYHF